jgi:predicted nucleotidyltransferase
MTQPMLELLVRERDRVLSEITAAARSAHVGCLQLVGSLGRGEGDAWSDVDLMAVPGPGYTDLDLSAVFTDRILATLDKPADAPAGGTYTGVCLAAGTLPLWLDLYIWPATTAAVCVDATIVFDELGLPHSELDFVTLLNAHPSRHTTTPTDSSAAILLRAAVAAKYLARGNLNRAARTLPPSADPGAPAMFAQLRQMAADVSNPGLAAAVAATQRLIDLAEQVAAGGHD